MSSALWAAFSFLTRFAPARVFPDGVMAASARWFPVTGAALGLVAVLPFLLGLAPAFPGVQAVLYLAIMAWSTRALHWDGLADCLDAFGSGAAGDAFQAVLKDSRIGSFGVLGIVLVFALQWACLAALFGAAAQANPCGGPSGVVSGIAFGDSPDAPLPLALLLMLIPALGRAAMLALPPLIAPHPASTLGRLVAPGCTPLLAVTWMIPLCMAFAALQGVRALTLLVLLSALALWFPLRIARREGGFNGDFLGCACLLTESAALLAAVAW